MSLHIFSIPLTAVAWTRNVGRNPANGGGQPSDGGGKPT